MRRFVLNAVISEVSFSPHIILVVKQIFCNDRTWELKIYLWLFSLPLFCPVWFLQIDQTRKKVSFYKQTLLNANIERIYDNRLS